MQRSLSRRAFLHLTASCQNVFLSNENGLSQKPEALLAFDDCLKCCVGNWPVLFNTQQAIQGSSGTGIRDCVRRPHRRLR